MRVLFIDDDAVWADGLIRIFRIIEGWDVVFVRSPKEAVDALRSSILPVDLIILDVMMAPDEVADTGPDDMGQSTGLALLETLAGMTEGRVPVVLLTARQDLAKVEFQSRAKLYLEKTLTADEIIDSIKGIFS